MLFSSKLQTFIDCREDIERAFLGYLMADETCIGNKLILVFAVFKGWDAKFLFQLTCHLLVNVMFRLILTFSFNHKKCSLVTPLNV